MMKLRTSYHLPGQQSMPFFHALTRLRFEALVIVSPDQPLASIGYFQDSEKEVDDTVIQDIGISDDFQRYLTSELSGLEQTLSQTKRNAYILISKIKDFCHTKNVENPGVEPEDVSQTIREAH